MIYLIGAISAVFAFWVVLVLRLGIRYAYHRLRGAGISHGVPDFRPDRIAIAAATAVLLVLLAAFWLVLP